MAYDPKTRSISIGPNTDFMADSGVFFIDTLRSLALRSGTPQPIIDDWRTIESWLGCQGRELNEQDREAIAKGWRAYLAMGISPSGDLKEAMDSISKGYQSTGKDFRLDLPPPDILGVFSRMMAAPANPKSSPAPPSPRPPQVTAIHPNKKIKYRETRIWIFVCSSWLVLSFFYIQIFAPFYYRFGDKYINDDQFYKSCSLMSIPIIAWILVFIFKKFVK